MSAPTLQRKIHRALFVGLLAVLVFVPLPYGSVRPMYWAFTEIAIFLLLAVRILIVPADTRLATLMTHPARNFVLVLFLIVVWLGIQAIGVGGVRSIDYHATASQMINTISFLCLALLVLSLVDSRERLRLVAWALVASGTFQAVYGTLAALGAGTFATGTYVNRNHLAGYLEMALSVGLGLLIADLSRGAASNWRDSLRRWISALLGAKARVRICLALMVIGLIVTRSRMGNTAFFAAMLIAAVVGLIIFRRSTRSVVLLFASLIVIDTLLMGTFFGIDKLQQRIEQTNLTTETRVTYNRLILQFVEAGVRHFAEPDRELRWRDEDRAPFEFSVGRVMLGFGAGTYYNVFPLLRDETIATQSIHAHNDYLEFALEFGILGYALLVLLVAFAIAGALKAQLRYRSRLVQSMGFASMMALLCIGIHSTADFNLQIYANALTFIAVLCLPFAAMALPQNGPRRGDRDPMRLAG